MSETRLLTDELKQLIEHETNYYAHEIVVPITGNPTTPYEINAVKKYKAEFTLFANKIIPLAFAAGEASQKEKDRQDTEYICTHKSFCCDKGENNECQAADDSVCDRRKPSKEQALKNKLIFKQAECDGLGSQLLEVQQDCIKAKQALAEARKEGARETYEELIKLMKDNANLENNERVIRIWLHLQSKLKELEE